MIGASHSEEASALDRPLLLQARDPHSRSAQLNLGFICTIRMVDKGPNFIEFLCKKIGMRGLELSRTSGNVYSFPQVSSKQPSACGRQALLWVCFRPVDAGL